MSSDTCFVITGLIEEEYIPSLIKSYEKISHKIISTWINQDENLIQILRTNGFIIVQDNCPIINKQTNYQSKAIHNGCLKAQELGYKYIIRLRTDMISSKSDTFVELLETKFFPNEKLVSFCGIETQDGIYFYDIMVAGLVSQMLEFFKNEQSIEDNRYIEKFLLESYLNKTDITRDDVRKIFNFCNVECHINRIEFFLIKYQLYIINEYCLYSFIWI